MPVDIHVEFVPCYVSRNDKMNRLLNNIQGRNEPLSRHISISNFIKCINIQVAFTKKAMN